MGSFVLLSTKTLRTYIPIVERVVCKGFNGKYETSLDPPLNHFVYTTKIVLSVTIAID